MTFEVRGMPQVPIPGGSGDEQCDSTDGSDRSDGSGVSACEEGERSPFCAFVREDGGKCRAMARRPSEYCFWHEPAQLASRQAERAGPASEIPVLDSCELKSGADVYALLERAALYAAFNAKPDLKRLQTLNVLASSLLRAIHVKELEEEVRTLREQTAEDGKSKRRMWDELQKQRYELEAERRDRCKWFEDRNKLRSYLRSIGTDPDSLPEKWLVNGISIFEHPP